MPKYVVSLIERSRRNILVEANDSDEALDKVQDAYYGEEIVLDYSDFEDFEMVVQDYHENLIYDHKLHKLSDSLN